jgi:hypothetical protein
MIAIEAVLLGHEAALGRKVETKLFGLRARQL